MPKFSTNSKSKLYTCDEPLIELFTEVVKDFDCTIVSAHRGADEQNKLYQMGRSQKQYPHSKHNPYPSKAVDVAPYGCWGKWRVNIVWPNKKEPTYARDLAVWYRLGGFVEAIALKMSIAIRWGGDWDGDYQINDQRFHDLAHWEIRASGEI
jgi:peptidoglycan LD-endopeptidase CwlK